METEKHVVEEEENAVEEAAREQLGVNRWDRPAIYRETAESATDADLPYWIILVLSGAIATLGVALDNSAVVIGAMLIAPLLAPVIGLALALAVGDGRLAVQTGAMVAGSTLAVIAISAVLTFALPFEQVTAEMTARMRPTILDLGIGVFSGLAGAVVTVTRGKRLSAAIPGVAISVALIPPLAVAGFGIGAGWRMPILKGSLLLFSANLAGIVLSGMAVFLLVGMHRPNVLEAVRRWHDETQLVGLTAWTDRLRWVRSLTTMQSVPGRLSLVLGFAVAVAVPLSVTFQEILREHRVQDAVDEEVALFDQEGQSSVLARRTVFGEDEARVYLSIATTEWFGEETRARFEEQASAAAGEPVRLVLEQIPTSQGDLDALAQLLPDNREQAAQQTPGASAGLDDLFHPIRERVRQATAGLALPDSSFVVGTELSVAESGSYGVRIAYLSATALPEPAEQMISRQLSAALRDPDVTVELTHVRNETLPLTGGAADSTRLRQLAALLQRYELLQAVLIASDSTSAVPPDSARRLLSAAGIQQERIIQRPGSGAARVHLQPAPQENLGK